jgi:hypothetical protein
LVFRLLKKSKKGKNPEKSGFWFLDVFGFSANYTLIFAKIGRQDEETINCTTHTSCSQRYTHHTLHCCKSTQSVRGSGDPKGPISKPPGSIGQVYNKKNKNEKHKNGVGVSGFGGHYGFPRGLCLKYLSSAVFSTVCCFSGVFWALDVFHRLDRRTEMNVALVCGQLYASGYMI